jgi:hypothetical protein
MRFLEQFPIFELNFNYFFSQNKVYMNNTIYFGEYLKEDKAWRGNLNLVWGDIVLERDPDNGLEYLSLAISVKRHTSSSQNKSHAKSQPKQEAQQDPTAPHQPRVVHRIKTGTQTSKLRAAAVSTATTASTNSSHSSGELSSPRVYARQPANLCPVEAYKVFKMRRPNNCLDRESPFYLAPNSKSKFTSKVWYKALAMSCQRLDALFYCLFKRADMDMSSLTNVTEEEQQRMIAVAMEASQATNDVVVWKSNKPATVVHKNAANTNNVLFGNSNSSSTINGGNLTAGRKSLKGLKGAKGIKGEPHQRKNRANNISNMQNNQITNGTILQYGSQGMNPILTTVVPVQVQVQVQVQVRPAQHQMKPPQLIQQQQIALGDTGSYQMLV